MIFQFNDALNLMSKASAPRIENARQILWSYYNAKRKRRPLIRGLPISVAYEPTTTCNLKCPHCPSGLRQFSRPTGGGDGDILYQIVDELAPTLWYLLFYFQGEPYLNKNFLDWVAYANQKNIYTATSTNAHYLDKENAERTVASGLDRLIISVDGADQESYEKYRIGGRLDKVIKGVENLLYYRKKLKRKTPHIILQFIVFKHNEHQIEDIKKLGKKMGVDAVGIKTAQIYDYENAHEFVPTQEKYARYKLGNDGKFYFKNKLEHSCWKMWHSCVVTWDGKVVPCCFDKDAQHRLGNLQKQSFTEVWNSEAYQHFRQQLLLARSKIDICKNCTEGTKVWA
ncbi:MAG: SPASM domain-containing protein [Bernardetiaceae bacterium]|nr:SPASM domain-containing protein [Bernardetiaceae bacterium]